MNCEDVDLTGKLPLHNCCRDHFDFYNFVIFKILKMVDSESARFSRAAVLPSDVCRPGGRPGALRRARVAADPLPLRCDPAADSGSRAASPALANSRAARLPAVAAATCHFPELSWDLVLKRVFTLTVKSSDRESFA